jgi:hypothetical protein
MNRMTTTPKPIFAKPGTSADLSTRMNPKKTGIRMSFMMDKPIIICKIWKKNLDSGCHKGKRQRQ